MNDGDKIACTWVKAHYALLVTFANAAADPEAFDLDLDAKEARLLFDEFKELKAKHWKLAGFLEQDPGDKLSCLPSLVLPPIAERFW